MFVFRCWSNTCNQFVKYIWLSLCKSLVEKREFVKLGINSEMYCFCFYINLIGVAFFKYNTDCFVFYFEQIFLNLINCIFACYYFLNKAFDVFLGYSTFAKITTRFKTYPCIILNFLSNKVINNIYLRQFSNDYVQYHKSDKNNT